MVSTRPRFPRRFSPRAIISPFGHLTQHYDTSKPPSVTFPKNPSADLMRNELESIVHVCDARDYGLTANVKPPPGEYDLTQPPDISPDFYCNMAVIIKMHQASPRSAAIDEKFQSRTTRCYRREHIRSEKDVVCEEC